MGLLTPTFLKASAMRWLLGRAIPQGGGGMLPILRVALLVLTAGILGGLLFALGFVGLCAVLFMFLQDQGLAATPALLIVAGVIFLIATAILVASQQIFRKHLELVQAKPVVVSPGPQTVEDLIIDLPRVVVSNFLNGMLGDSDTPRSYRPH
jgi:hypothetical protein